MADPDEVDTYLQMMWERPAPTIEQTKAFVLHLADVHSWYKKLALMGAGEPFFVHFDPYPMHAFTHGDDGQTRWRELTVEQETKAGILRPFQIEGCTSDDSRMSASIMRNRSRGRTTQEWIERFGFWSYWEWGYPDQPRDEALDQADQELRVRDESASPLAVPTEVLERGLVYLRGTVSPGLGPKQDEYAVLQETHGLVDHAADRQSQLDEIEVALNRVAAWVYGEPDSRSS